MNAINVWKGSGEERKLLDVLSSYHVFHAPGLAEVVLSYLTLVSDPYSMIHSGAFVWWHGVVP